MNITELLQEYNVPIAPQNHHHRTVGREQVDCPFCSKDSQRWRLGIRTDNLHCYCWTCGNHWIGEALAELTGESTFKLLNLLERSNTFRQPEKPKGRLKLPKGIGPLQNQHKRYLLGRGFDPEEIEKLWKIQGIGIAPKLSWRIFIPIILEGDTVSWTTRAITDEIRERYINASVVDEKISPKTILYGMDYVRHSIVVTEGPTDCWRLGPGAVATCGVGWKIAQLNLIGKIPKRTICFDSESAAQQRAKDLANELSLFPGTTKVIQLDAADPGKASKREVAKVRREFMK